MCIRDSAYLLLLPRRKPEGTLSFVIVRHALRHNYILIGSQPQQRPVQGILRKAVAAVPGLMITENKRRILHKFFDIIKPSPGGKRVRIQHSEPFTVLPATVRGHLIKIFPVSHSGKMCIRDSLWNVHILL